MYTESGPSGASLINDPLYEPDDDDDDDGMPSLMSQAHLDRIVRKLHLSQRYAEILARELKHVNILEPGIKISGYRNRQAQFLPYFTLSADKTYAYCNNIGGLLIEMGVENYDADKWRIFIDSSKSSLKAVLLYEDSSIKPLPILYALKRQETYDTMKWVLDTVDYDLHKWRASCDLKVVTLLCGLQTGYTKYCCAFCRTCDWTIKC